MNQEDISGSSHLFVALCGEAEHIFRMDFAGGINNTVLSSRLLNHTSSLVIYLIHPYVQFFLHDEKWSLSEG